MTEANEDSENSEGSLFNAKKATNPGPEQACPPGYTFKRSGCKKLESQ